MPADQSSPPSSSQSFSSASSQSFSGVPNSSTFSVQASTSNQQSQIQIVQPSLIQSGSSQFPNLISGSQPGLAPGLQFGVPQSQGLGRQGVSIPQQGVASSGFGQQLVTLPGGQQALVRYAAPQMVQVPAPQQFMTVQIPVSTPTGTILQQVQVPVQQQQPQVLNSAHFRTFTFPL